MLEWHTGQAQTLLSERTCGFESHPPHMMKRKKLVVLILAVAVVVGVRQIGFVIQARRYGQPR